MTDEELADKYAEEYFGKKTELVELWKVKAYKEAFLAGLKAGRPEWHKVADGDLPTKELEEKQLLVRVRNYTEDCIFAYYMLDKYCSKNGKRFYSDIDCDYPIDIEDIIAWKEIVLPELKESE